MRLLRLHLVAVSRGRGHAAVIAVDHEAQLCFDMRLQKADRQIQPTNRAETCSAVLMTTPGS